MLNEKWIPTPIPSHDQGNAQDVEIGTATTPRWRRLQVIMRLLELVKNLFLLWVRRQWSPKNCGICTRNFFESLGFLWIKAGQLVALRHDFFSSEFCTELGKLQYIAKGFSPELSCRILKRNWGHPWTVFLIILNLIHSRRHQLARYTKPEFVGKKEMLS